MAFGAIAVAIVLLDNAHLPVHLPAGVHESGGALIALVLAFRANTAYNRFWEGRSLWGSLVNASRNLHRLAQQHTQSDAATTGKLSKLIVGFAHATRRHLRSENTCPEVARLLTEEEFAEFELATHRPLYIAEQLSGRVNELRLRGAFEPNMAAWAERLVGLMVDSLGGCERIQKTPTPLSFVLLMQRFLALYLATLPFALVTRVEALTPVVTMLIAYPILLVDALGAELDDPFGHDPSDLPLTRICMNIERNILGTEPAPEMVYAKKVVSNED